MTKDQLVIRLKAVLADIERYSQDVKSDNWEIAHGASGFLKEAEFQRDIITLALTRFNQSILK